MSIMMSCMAKTNKIVVILLFALGCGKVTLKANPLLAGGLGVILAGLGEYYRRGEAFTEKEIKEVYDQITKGADLGDLDVLEEDLVKGIDPTLGVLEEEAELLESQAARQKWLKRVSFTLAVLSGIYAGARIVSRTR